MENNNGLWIIAIVAIVAVVSLIMMNKTSLNNSATDNVGQVSQVAGPVRGACELVQNDYPRVSYCIKKDSNPCQGQCERSGDTCYCGMK
jgi:hypothetical protein